MFSDSLTTVTVLGIFTDEVRQRGGELSDTFDDGQRLFVRSLLPHLAYVRAKDRLQSGLALRMADGELWLYPYVFRQVCRNGAIMAHSIDSLHIETLDSCTPDFAECELRAAIAACSDEQTFSNSVRGFRSAADSEADVMLNMMPILSRLREAKMGREVAHILEQFFSGGDRSRFGLMNAVTSVARDMSDPDEKWRLEELGGAIGAGFRPKPPISSPGRNRYEPALVPTR